MSRISLLSVTACAMCPAAAPTERDRAMATGGAPAGPGCHVALHTPSVFTAPVDYHPTSLFVEAGRSDDAVHPAGAGKLGHGRSVFWPEGNVRPMPGQQILIPGSRSHITLNDPQPGALLAPAGTGPTGAALNGVASLDFDTPPMPPRQRGAADGPAVINHAHTWHAPEHVRISGERCAYRPWNATGPTGLTTAGQPSSIEAPRSEASSDEAGPDRRLPVPAPPGSTAESPHGLARAGGPAAVWYAAGGVLLLVIAGVLARRRLRD
ncbi:hypothetical protein [Streptomyces sp. NPDC088348]|uniref:hypothetical protein n=1 Tax=Streptomyces sp. NPDC088348 TaxID=3365853 RepID=UPI003804A9A9